MPITDDFIKYVTQRKTAAENLENDLKNQITVKAQQIREAGTDHPGTLKLQTEMEDLQDKYVAEPEAKVPALCKEIQAQTDLTEVEILRRHEEASDRNLKGL